MWVSEIFMLFGLGHVERERTEYRTWIFQRKKEKKNMEEGRESVGMEEVKCSGNYPKLVGFCYMN